MFQSRTSISREIAHRKLYDINLKNYQLTIRQFHKMYRSDFKFLPPTFVSIFSDASKQSLMYLLMEFSLSILYSEYL